jgi:hypothetical protein
VLSWLISRRLAQKQDGSEADQLKRLRQRIQLLLEGNSAVLEQWQHCLEGSETLALSGPGLQAQIADRASLCLFEWAGIQASVIPWPASSYPHAAGWTVIELCSSLLSGAGEASEQTQSSQTIRLLDGYPQRANDPLRPTAGLPVELENLLNWVSLQLLASSINCK